MLLSGTRLQIGQCSVNFASGELQRDGEAQLLESRLARLLMYLAHRPGEVVSIDELLDQVWEGVVVSPDSVYQAITALRKALDDDPKKPSYIVTVPKRGYKFIAPVKNLDTQSNPLPALPPAIVVETNTATKPRLKMLIIAALVLAFIAVGAVFYEFGHRGGVSNNTSTQTATATRTMVVLPFLDMTDSMTEEPFADGMVEELISKLSRVPGLSVSPAADSFFYKDKDFTTGDVAKALHVAFLLEGSVRKSGDTLRVAVRLTRASDHFVIWSETYDRPWHDKLSIQDDIASAVSRSLAKSF